MAIVGIDPGASGGIAILMVNGHPWEWHKMPDTSADLAELLARCNLSHERIVVYVESVHSSPQMGVSSAFKLGRNVGVIEGVLTALGLRIEYVSPQKWQKEMGCLAKGRTLAGGDREKKNANKAAAQRLFPGIKITHAIADALLIAEYGRRCEAVRQGAA